MYLPAQSFFASRIQGGRQTGGDADSGYDIIDSIIQWFARIFAPLREYTGSVHKLSSTAPH